ncbi:HAD family phosphatase [Massilibacteroides sp.]|uniref:HAD family hydrolase n=1 Tax=Massilibacteroides sp. TaxID=2034766 RepID=UPI00261BB650|nr:HAD family phosphatase [Massilibacteroides sp.]MDD4514071.1 HAD family phosphatase [Massilibacteroides sp.]
MAEIKNIVFDLGGVIIDLDRECSVRRFRELGVDNVEEMLDPYEQRGLFLGFENGSVSLEEFRSQLSEMIGKDLTAEDVAYGWMGFIQAVPQYKLDYILDLKKKYKVYILSNTNPVVYEWAKTSRFSESGLPVTAYCEKFYASFEMKVTKPNPRIFELMIKDSGMIPSETLFIDDGKLNVEQGEQLGFVTYQPENKEDWRESVNRILKGEA